MFQFRRFDLLRCFGLFCWCFEHHFQFRYFQQFHFLLLNLLRYFGFYRCFECCFLQLFQFLRFDLLRCFGLFCQYFEHRFLVHHFQLFHYLLLNLLRYFQLLHYQLLNFLQCFECRSPEYRKLFLQLFLQLFQHFPYLLQNLLLHNLLEFEQKKFRFPAAEFLDLQHYLLLRQVLNYRFRFEFLLHLPDLLYYLLHQK